MKKASFESKAARIKQAPVNMRKEEHQFVIDAYLVDEVLSQLPPGINILGGLVVMFQADPNSKIAVPNAVRKYGVSSIYKMGSITRGQVTFDAISKESLKRNLKRACAALNMRRPQAYFKYLLLTNGKGNVMFRHTTKEIRPDETDLRKKLRVLGATEGQGQVQSVIADLNAKKYRCVIKEEPVKFVMCYKD